MELKVERPNTCGFQDTPAFASQALLGVEKIEYHRFRPTVACYAHFSGSAKLRNHEVSAWQVHLRLSFW